MSEKELVNNGEVMEQLGEVSYSNGNGLAKVAIVGAVIALGVAAVVIVRRRRAKQLIEQELIVVEETTAKRKPKNTEE